MAPRSLPTRNGRVAPSQHPLRRQTTESRAPPPRPSPAYRLDPIDHAVQRQRGCSGGHERQAMRTGAWPALHSDRHAGGGARKWRRPL